MCIAVVLPTSVLVAEGQLGGQEVTATICGLFRDADTGQYHNTTLDLVAELEQPTGAWELVADEEYEVEVTLDDNQGEHVGRVTILDPEGEVIDEANADPPAATLTASGSFAAGRVYTLGYVPEVKVIWKPGDELSVEVGWKWVADPPPAEPPTKLEVGILDMTEGAPGIPIPSFVVEIWPEGHQELNRWKTTNMQGVAVFSGIDPGKWVVHVVGTGATGACDYEFSSVVVKHATKLESARIWQHRPIAGKLWFKDDAGQVVGGYPGEVTLELLQGGEPVEAVTPMVNTTANPDGSYPYSVPSEFLIAGDYVLRASLGQSTDNKNVTYPNHCANALPQAHFTHRAPGAHVQVEGPELVIIVDDDPPEIP
jgi:hypothetical protein